MQIKFTIEKDGKIKTEVVDREDQECSNVLKITQSLGKTISHEQTGPECDKVEEIVG